MTSKVEEPAIETQGYFRYGISSFTPNNSQKLKQLPQKRRTRQQEISTKNHVRRADVHKPTISLPNIHVSKLKERPARKLTHSLKCDDDKTYGSSDCTFCNGGKRKRLLPSLAASCLLSKLDGKVYQGSSWWEWSKREYRIKETRFDVGEIASNTGAYGSGGGTGSDTAFSIHDVRGSKLINTTSSLPPDAAMHMDSHLPIDTMQNTDSRLLSVPEGTGKPLHTPTQLHKSLYNLGKYPPLHKDDEDLRNFRNGQPRSMAGVLGKKLSTHERSPGNNISLFNFDLISENKPVHQKWSKLTALPHIQTESRHVTFRYDHFKDSDFSGSGIDPGVLPLADEQPDDGTSIADTQGNEVSSTSATQIPVNVRNIMLGANLLPKERVPSIKKSKLSSMSSTEKHVDINGRKELGGESVTNKIMSDYSDSEISDSGSTYRPAKRNRRIHSDREHISTISIGNSLLDKQSRANRKQGDIKKRLTDLRNAVLIDNWIKILESTKEDSDVCADDTNAKVSHENVPARNMSVGRGGQEKVANIDLVSFFNQSDSTVGGLSKKRLNNTATIDSEDQLQNQLPQGANNQVINAKTPQVKDSLHVKMPIGKEGLLSPRRDRQERSTRYIRWSQQANGLTELLAVQRLHTKEAPGVTSTNDGNDVHEEKALPNEWSLDTDESLSKNGGKNRLHIQVDLTQKRTDDSMVVKPIARRPLKRGGFDLESQKDSKVGWIGRDANDQHLQNLLQNFNHLDFFREERGTNRQNKTRRVKHTGQSMKREVVGNKLYSDLMIVGSSALDMSELKWREEVKALIRAVMKTKEGRSLNKEQLKKLQSFYNQLESDIPISSGDKPEDFLSKLLDPSTGKGKGRTKQGVYYPDADLFEEESASSSEDLGLAFDDDWLEKQDVDELLSQVSSTGDPQLFKQLIKEKLKRELGVSGADEAELMKYIDDNVHIMVDPESGKRIPVIPPSLAKIIAKRKSQREHQNADSHKGEEDVDRADLLAMLRGDGKAHDKDAEDGYYFDFESGTVRKLDEFSDGEGHVKLLNATEVDFDDSIPEGLRSYVSRRATHTKHGGKRHRQRRRGMEGERDEGKKGHSRRRRRRRGVDGEEVEDGGSQERRERRRKRRGMEDEEGILGRGKRGSGQDRRERRRRRRELEGSGEFEDREERRRRRRERRRKKREEEETGESGEERRRRRRRRRRGRERYDSEEESESDDSVSGEGKEKEEKRRQGREEPGTEDRRDMTVKEKVNLTTV